MGQTSTAFQAHCWLDMYHISQTTEAVCSSLEWYEELADRFINLRYGPKDLIPDKSTVGTAASVQG